MRRLASWRQLSGTAELDFSGRSQKQVLSWALALPFAARQPNSALPFSEQAPKKRLSRITIYRTT